MTQTVLLSVLVSVHSRPYPSLPMHFSAGRTLLRSRADVYLLLVQLVRQVRFQSSVPLPERALCTRSADADASSCTAVKYTHRTLYPLLVTGSSN